MASGGTEFSVYFCLWATRVLWRQIGGQTVPPITVNRWSRAGGLLLRPLPVHGCAVIGLLCHRIGSGHLRLCRHLGVGGLCTDSGSGQVGGSITTCFSWKALFPPAMIDAHSAYDANRASDRSTCLIWYSCPGCQNDARNSMEQSDLHGSKINNIPTRSQYQILPAWKLNSINANY